MPTEGPARPIRGPAPLNRPLIPSFLQTSSNMRLVFMFNNLSGSFSICLRVLATSRGQVAPAEITPAINPAEKFAPNITAALLLSPTNPVKCLLVGSRTVQHIAEKGTSRASCAPRPVHRRWYPRKFSGLLMLCLDESTPSKVFHIPGGFPPTFDSLKACIRVLANSIGEQVMHASDRAIVPEMRGAYGLSFGQL